MINLALAALLTANIASSNYKLQWTNLNLSSDSKPATEPAAPNESVTPASSVKAGFPYIKTVIPFAFTVSDLSIDFGVLSTGVFATQANTLTISSEGSGGYRVTAYEDHPLKMPASAITIPNISSGGWTDTNKYGFGYNLSGDDIPPAFNSKTYFKPFADASQSESGTTMMSSPNVGQSQHATVTYRVNVGPTQPSGDYENSIYFIATPGY